MREARRENLFRMLRGDTPSWIPFTLDVGAIKGFTKPVLERFRRETGSDDPAEYFDYDFRAYSLKSEFGGSDPSACHGTLPAGTVFDEWGIGRWSGGSESTVDKMYPPLAGAGSTEEVEGFPSPAIVDAEGGEVERIHRRGYPVFGYAGSLYEWSWWLRGMERFMTDLILRPDMARAVVEKVTGHTMNLALRSARAGVDVLCFYDDVGMQTGMQISPELWRRFIKPGWAKVIGEVHAAFPEAGLFLHSCGNITPILSDIAELGFQILHPVQPECMDLMSAAAAFGRRMVMCSTLSAQRTFPFGQPDEVRAEVRRLKGLFRETRRTILCPSNAIQPETPWENVVAFCEEACRQEPRVSRA